MEDNLVRFVKYFTLEELRHYSKAHPRSYAELCRHVGDICLSKDGDTNIGITLPFKGDRGCVIEAKKTPDNKTIAVIDIKIFD